ncbi:lipoate--protein ligase family protein [Prevotella sp. P6B1]|uniref:lipoate--protein ligase family protein n=1 Tax=Prevotella sp. P6B1 TaxID=1410613 RepID=UPI00051AB5F0|nr:lipoate--protein ligase family protein [Prevotella sp. P6B1]
MKYIALPTNENRQLSFYLAMEEYVARHISEPDCFFMWQVAPTVIFGRNQVVENEVNLEYCREHDIRVVRRKSGGGCVYADMDNLMLSMVTDGDNVGFTFNRFVTMIQLALHKIGVTATSTAHNDIMIGDRKVCGTAFYQLPGRSIVHSTMLYDTNMQHMLNAITPSAEKLEKKGIQSVRQRITLLKDHTPLSLKEIKQKIRDTLCDGNLVLTEEQVAGIEEIEQTYLKQDFIHLIQ